MKKVMRGKGIKKTIYLGLLVAIMIMIAGCNRQEPISAENVSDAGSETLSTQPESDSEITDDSGEMTESDSAEEVDESTVEETSVPEISEEELHRLVDGNYFCITNAFEYGRLSMEGSTDGRVVVSNEYFAGFAQFEDFIRSIYTEEEADYLLYEYCGGFPLYYEKDGVFYQRAELFGGGMVCPWESYVIEDIEGDDDECRFSVYATYPADIAPKGVPGERYEYLAVKEDDGWKLAFIVSRRDCSLEEAQEYLAKDRAAAGVDIDYENLITEKEALEIAYNFIYEGSDIEQYRTYCDAMPYFDPKGNATVQMDGITYEEKSGLGYVAMQYGEGGMESFDAANPSPDKTKTCLTYIGKSENDAFYVFWLYSYISDGDGEYHYSSLDFILVSADGRELVSERHDANGAYIEDSLEWKDFTKFLDCEIVNSWIF